MGHYLPRHDTQYEPRSTRWSPLDCNMAAAADAARYWSLGLIDHNHLWYRLRSGDTSGGTTIDTAALVLSKVGVRTTKWDSLDGQGIANVLSHLSKGEMVIAHGDYGSVPRSLRGSIAPGFTGMHSVFLGRRTATGVKVGDGLSEGWLHWPNSVVRDYMRDFPGGGFTYLHVKPRYLTPKTTHANVRPEPNRSKPIIHVLRAGSRLMYGGIVQGEMVSGSNNWYRVWVPAINRIGYVRASVVKSL